ncbi:ABC transporter permease [Mycoplasmatota bacterium]|nr:ABC transporter permease [Mycoplasmatota bacterium]
MKKIESSVVKSQIKTKLKDIVVNHNYVFSLIIMLIIGAIASPNFLSAANLIQLLRASTIIGIIALGMTLVIISGNIDLSVGSILGFVAAIAVIVYNATGSILLTLLFTLAFGLLLGLINGFFVGKTHIAGFIVTLATMVSFRSLTVKLGEGGPLLMDNDLYYEGLRTIGYGKFLGIPYLGWIFILTTVIVWLVMTKTKFGRYVYAVGSNEKAAKLSGIKVDLVKVLVYGIAGLLSGLAAFLYISRFGSVDTSTAGSSFELDAIAAVAIGGASMAGGKGFIQGTFFGVIILYSIDAILNAFGVSAFLIDFIKGMLILGAVLVQKSLNKNKENE